jgi:hypothetical protein
MSVQKSHLARPNKAHLHANNLYRLMIEVRALRNEARLLDGVSEAKAPDLIVRSQNRKCKGSIGSYPK